MGFNPGAKRFSIASVLVLTTLIAIVMAILLPAFLKAREEARRMFCSGSAAQIGLAIHNHHSAFKRMPQAMGGMGIGNAGRISGLVALMPFLQEQGLYRRISNPLIGEKNSYPAFGPPPWDKDYPPWQENLDVFRCPSDYREGEVFGRTNFVFSVGDLIVNMHQPKSIDHVRGAFAPGYAIRFRDIADGLSNTVMMTEIATENSRSIKGQFVVDVPIEEIQSPQDTVRYIDPGNSHRYLMHAKLSDLGRGGHWADGAAGYSLVQTIMPPNSPSCAIEGTMEVDGIYSASSRHQGGCHVIMCDGAVIFMTDSVDAGDLTQLPPESNIDPDGNRRKSPYGIWGQIGTRAGREIVEERLNR